MHSRAQKQQDQSEVMWPPSIGMGVYDHQRLAMSATWNTKSAQFGPCVSRLLWRLYKFIPRLILLQSDCKLLVMSNHRTTEDDEVPQLRDDNQDNRGTTASP